MAIIKFKRYTPPVAPINVYAYRARISATTPCSAPLTTVWTNASFFGTGVQLWLNRALTIPAGSGRIACFESVNGGDPGTIGEIFNVSAGLIGTSTGVIC